MAEAPKVNSRAVELVFFSGRRGRVWLAEKTEGATPTPHIKLSDRGLAYTFDRPVFVEEIQVFCPAGEGHGPKVRVEVLRAADGARVRLNNGAVDDDKCLASVSVDQLISGFGIYTNRGLLEFNDKVSGIKVTGLFLEDLEEIEDATRQYRDLSAQVSSLIKSETAVIQRERRELAEAKAAHEKTVQADRTALENSRTEHNAEIEKLKAEVKALREAVSKTEKDLKTKTTELAGTSDRLVELEETQIQREAQINELNSRQNSLHALVQERDAEIALKSQRVAELNEELMQLNSDKSLFTDDMVGITKQGAGQVRAYLWILVPVLLTGAALATLSVSFRQACVMTGPRGGVACRVASYRAVVSAAA